MPLTEGTFLAGDIVWTAWQRRRGTWVPSQPDLPATNAVNRQLAEHRALAEQMGEERSASCFAAWRAGTKGRPEIEVCANDLRASVPGVDRCPRQQEDLRASPTLAGHED